jgi:hypothetical protein
MSQPKYLYSVSRLLGGTRAAKLSALGRLVGLADKFDPVPTSTVPTFTGHPPSRWLLTFGRNWRSHEVENA